MKFLKNLFLLLLVLTPSVTWAEAKDECTISFVNSSNGNFVLKKCSFSKTESSYKEYPVLGPTEKLTQSTLPLEKYLTEAMETGKLVTVEHKPSYEFTSIIPPKERSTTSQILFVDNEFRVNETETHTYSALLIILYIWIIIPMINSGNTGKITFNPNERFASFSIMAASIVGVILGITANNIYFGLIAGAICGAAIGIYKGVKNEPYNNNDWIVDMIGASVVGAIASGLVAYIVGANGLTASFIFEWTCFCLLMVVLEYTVVAYRSHQEKEKMVLN